MRTEHDHHITVSKDRSFVSMVKKSTFSKAMKCMTLSLCTLGIPILKNAGRSRTST